jgi:hypothetical protein
LLRRVMVVILGGALFLSLAAPAEALHVIATWRLRGPIQQVPGFVVSVGTVDACLGTPTACRTATRTGTYFLVGGVAAPTPLSQCNLSLGAFVMQVNWAGAATSVIVGRGVQAVHTLDFVGTIRDGAYTGSLVQVAIKFRRLLRPCEPFVLGSAGKLFIEHIG